jgi:putative aminopeptidase FrvX
MTETFDLIKTLCEIPGPVGHEDRVQDWIAERWSGFAQETRRTRVDNVISKVGGSGKRLAIMAHADEICFMVKAISDDGFLHIWPYYADTRGYPPRWVMPLNQPVLVVTSTGLVDGVFATASGHVVGNRDNPNFRYEWNDWFIDIGASSRDEALALGVRPGARVIWNPPVRRLGKTHIVGKAMDDRVALAIATLAGEALAKRDDLQYEVWLVSTVQEENGLIGASSVSDEIELDRCVNLDVGLTGDIPGPDKRDFPSKLGAGPIVVYQDMTVHYSRRLADELVAVADSAGLPVQQAIFQSYGSDGAPLFRRGVETALLTYPTRYTHSPIETVDENDVRACVDLLVAFATTPAPEERR